MLREDAAGVLISVQISPGFYGTLEIKHVGSVSWESERGPEVGAEVESGRHCDPFLICQMGHGGVGGGMSLFTM